MFGKIIKKFFDRKPKLNIDFSDDIIVSPSHSEIKYIRQIKDGLVKGKNGDLRLENILKEQDIRDFDNGIYINQYLSPSNIHRVYFPCDGKIIYSFYYGSDKLYPVRYDKRGELSNERLTGIIETNYGFNLGLIMIGSVLKIPFIPIFKKKIGIEQKYEYKKEYKKGNDYGKFKIGSTVILFFPENKVDILVKEKDKVKIGRGIARIK